MSKQDIQEDVSAEDATTALEGLIQQQGISPVSNLDELSDLCLPMMTPTSFSDTSWGREMSDAVCPAKKNQFNEHGALRYNRRESASSKEKARRIACAILASYAESDSSPQLPERRGTMVLG